MGSFYSTTCCSRCHEAASGIGAPDRGTYIDVFVAGWILYSLGEWTGVFCVRSCVGTIDCTCTRLQRGQGARLLSVAAAAAIVALAACRGRADASSGLEELKAAYVFVFEVA